MTNYQTDVFEANSYARVKNMLRGASLLRDEMTVGQAIERNEDEEMKSYYDWRAGMEEAANDSLMER